MCGILLNISKERIEADHPALNVIAHRGPDAFGAESFDFPDYIVSLGHRRLSILDLSERARQPMSYNNGSLWITYNGEIYNYLELKDELQAIGFSFKSDSDTEVVLAAYQKWGAACLSKFNGMFAFAILDKSKNELFCARDRFGIKPLYYNNSSNGLAFFSEIKQLPLLNHSSSEVNYEQLYHFMNSGDFEFDSHSIWKGVREVPPGHCLTIKLENWRLGDDFQITSWYELDVPINNDITFSDAVSEFRHLLDQSLKLRLRSDVPVGFLLSGGLDSSTLVCLAHLATNVPGGNLRTYSSCFDDKSVDEREYIKAVLDDTGADSCLHFPSADQVMSSVDKVIWHNDLPIIPGSPCPHWLLYEQIKNETNSRVVILEGQGADEILCGYGDFQIAGMFENLRWNSMPSFISQLSNFYLKHPQKPHVILRKLRRLMFSGSVKYPCHPILKAESFFSDDAIPQIAVKREARTVSQLHMNRLKILKYILHYVDRNSMSHSRETRVPFLDHNLVEFCLSLPTEFKVANGVSKRVMRDAVSDVLPEKIKNRFDKKGYSSPTAQWAKSSWREILSKEMEKCEELPFVNKKALRESFDSSIAEKGFFDPIIWRLFTLRRWIEIFKVNL